MTEDEATQKQCCGPEGCGVHNDLPYPARWCVGSPCMAWRWDLTPAKAARLEGERTGTLVKEPIVASGYCGLVGAPR